MEKLKFYREKAGISQIKLAEAIGKTNSYISALEKGKYTPLVKVAKEIAKVLDVDNWWDLYD